MSVAARLVAVQPAPGVRGACPHCRLRVKAIRLFGGDRLGWVHDWQSGEEQRRAEECLQEHGRVRSALRQERLVLLASPDVRYPEGFET